MNALLVAAVALAASHPAAAGGFTRAKQLEPAASYVAGKPVRVLCANSDAAWHQYEVATYGSDDGGNGSTAADSTTIRLSYLICTATIDRLAGIAIPLKTLAPSIEVLTHEAIHARGASDEGVTDCDAVHEMPRVAVTFMRVKAGKQLRALMAAAWAWRATESAPYRAVC